MLITLLIWLYITFLCWSWGYLFISWIKKFVNEETALYQFSFVCIIGLCLITIIAGWLSLFIPLGNWWVQLIFFIPALLIVRKSSANSFFSNFKKSVAGLHILSLLLLLSCLLLILVMATWAIVHPDTLGYHAQTIQWIEKYKVVPGLVHLHSRFGYQGSWFVDNALFSFNFTGISGFTFLNSTVLFWLLVFIINRINFHFFNSGTRLQGFCWMTLFALSMWSYTQIRLTATSASPDFIATIFILAIVYILVEKTKKLTSTDWMIAGLLGLIAVTIKLSAGFMLIIVAVALIIFLRQKKFKEFLIVFAITIVSVFPLITRNIITSGYAFFPSTFIDIADADWKYDKVLTVNEKNYITAYAKKQGIATKTEIDAVNEMSITEWLPGWWKQRTVADKTIMLFFVISFFSVLFIIKKLILAGYATLFVMLTLIIGFVFWFINAPDPRFGFGQILGFVSIIAYLLFKEREINISKNVVIVLFMIAISLVLTYTSYRFDRFFKKDQWLKPLGIEKKDYTIYDCNGITINKISDGGDFGVTPVPCTDLDCDKFSPRGNKVTDGFQAK